MVQFERHNGNCAKQMGAQIVAVGFSTILSSFSIPTTHLEFANRRAIERLHESTNDN
jgi:hypothetical protein